MENASKRTLKIYYAYHGPPYSKHPMIRLAGNYLSAMGYGIGDEVEVTIEKHQIIIVKKAPLHVAPRETGAGSAGAQPARDTSA